MRNWYSCKAQGSTLSLSIHDQIGTFGVEVKDFVKDVRAAKAVTRIDLSIHSPGGSAFDGIAIYNVLKDHPAKVHVRIEGVAASAASIVAMAGDVITMPSDTWMMIHNAWTMAMGNAEELRDAADFLDRISASLVNIYVRRTGLDEQIVRDLLDAETWISADEAAEYGLADVVADPVSVAALSNDFAKHFAQVPAAIRNSTRDIDAIDSMKEFEGYLREAGCTRAQATSLACRVKKIAQSESDAVNESENEAKALEAVASLISKF